MTWALRLPAAAVAGGIGALLLSAGAYAADSPRLLLAPLSGPPGTTVIAQGTAFCVSCGAVEIDFGAQPVKQGILVLSGGSFQATFVVPGGVLAGTNAVNAYQQGKLVYQTSFTVTPSVPPPTTTATPRQTSSPPLGPSAGGGPSPGGGASASPQPTSTPTVSAAGPSPAASNAGTGSSSGRTSATGTAIVLSALALLVVAIAAAFLYRRLKAKPLS